MSSSTIERCSSGSITTSSDLSISSLPTTARHCGKPAPAIRGGRSMSRGAEALGAAGGAEGIRCPCTKTVHSVPGPGVLGHGWGSRTGEIVMASSAVEPAPAGEGVTPAEIMQLGLGFWASKTLLSAIELGVFTELASGAAEEGELRVRLGLHERSCRDFLDALVALGMLERGSDGYSNTAATDLFLDRAKPTYAGGMLEMANERLYGFWGTLTEALRTGEP